MQSTNEQTTTTDKQTTDIYGYSRTPLPQMELSEVQTEDDVEYQNFIRQFDISSDVTLVVKNHKLPPLVLTAIANLMAEISKTKTLTAVLRTHPETVRSVMRHCQKTTCAVCGEYKHTPLRNDKMGGYVCLACIDKKLNEQ